MTQRSRRLPLIKLILILVIIAAVGFSAFRILQIKQSETRSDEVINTMKSLIPGLGTETGVSTGNGRDPLVSLSVNDVNVVGCLEIPSINLMIPVTVKGETEDGFASVVSGSPVKGKFMLEGDRETTFVKLSRVQPGDRVAFTDIDGIRYSYSVTTQYHLKDWDEGDNDLMVTFRSDDQTRFVLGCAINE